MTATSRLFNQHAIRGHGPAQFFTTVLVLKHLARRFGQGSVNRHSGRITAAIAAMGRKIR